MTLETCEHSLWQQLLQPLCSDWRERHWSLKPGSPVAKIWTIPFLLCVLGQLRQTQPAWIFLSVLNEVSQCLPCAASSVMCHDANLSFRLQAFPDLSIGWNDRAFFDPLNSHWNSHNTVVGWWYWAIVKAVDSGTKLHGFESWLSLAGWWLNKVTRLPRLRIVGISKDYCKNWLS